MREKFSCWLLGFGVCLIIGIWLLGFAPAGAMGGPPPKKTEAAAPVVLAGKVFLIDDFESGSLKSPREWWVFDIKKGEVVSNKDLKDGEPEAVKAVGNYSFHFEGDTTSWYCGGAGTYLARPAQDLSVYKNVQMDIYGNGSGSGMLKIELYDDDDGNWQMGQDPDKGYAPLYDDRFVYEEKVDWKGWKKVIIPIADFVDDNPKVGDDIWNPQQAGGSGGLLQVQFICIANTSRGIVNFMVDNLSLTME
ncbi:hypothetical protein HZB08_00960 [Candidatus Saganbacteria bacterium]|uniref:Uncharacterized protein n=1 Tax=Candidatus Saganbacteria bacterium TaxID=2575572 RepID=A0A9D6UKN6_UNCSA|nr:hypothetical protein [Candidatus Saganbacteria bacterium]